MAEALLALDDVRAGYGDAVVLDGITLGVPQGRSLAVLGRNGVGKSTLLLTIMGFTRISRGAVIWRGRDITRAAPHWRARNGLAWVAQEREIFPSLDVGKSGTRKEELLVDQNVLTKMWVLRRILMQMGTVDAMQFLLDKMKDAKSNEDFFASMNQ